MKIKLPEINHLMKRFTLFVIFLPLAGYCFAQLSPSNEVDVQHYSFHIELNDSSDAIKGKAEIQLKARKDISSFELDLIGKTTSPTGMIVDQIVSGNTKARFAHTNDRVNISFPSSLHENDVITITIHYHGIPADGLIISKNKFGDRTFFADNWPNRGRNWLPVIDHPADKATVEWSVIAPLHYEVVANGVRVEESFLNENQKLTRYKEEAPISTKVMVIGVARFAIEQAGTISGIPIETWVYPQNRKEGFNDFKYAVKIVEYFQNNIGEYAYRKLANVQSKTTFGGLENASAIFYFEGSVNGKGEREALIAHEIAHQWFGDAATEKEWKDVWLSEGFATYFAILYLEQTYGEHRRQQEMKKDRNEVIAFEQKNITPVVQPVTTDLLKILNANSYQKGSWVLHMLRREVGDELFWKGIREYYARYKNSNASTDDFRTTMETVSKKDLKAFFQQWIYTPGQPVFDVKWKFNEKTGEAMISITQLQNQPAFKFPLEIGFSDEKGNIFRKETVKITERKHDFLLKIGQKPLKIELDPDVNLLFESNSNN
jgi:aminopeptidase N